MLEVGGLLLFSTYGPDTLKELRAAFAPDSARHVNTFVDMHDLGDALVAAGFADPVMEMETITLEYASVEALARDLKSGGGPRACCQAARVRAGRTRDAARPHGRAGLRSRAPRGRGLPATYEVVYGHAWKTAPRRIADGRQVIGFESMARP